MHACTSIFYFQLQAVAHQAVLPQSQVLAEIIKKRLTVWICHHHHRQLQVRVAILAVLIHINVPNVPHQKRKVNRKKTKNPGCLSKFRRNSFEKRIQFGILGKHVFILFYISAEMLFLLKIHGPFQLVVY